MRGHSTVDREGDTRTASLSVLDKGKVPPAKSNGFDNPLICLPKYSASHSPRTDSSADAAHSSPSFSPTCAAVSSFSVPSLFSSLLFPSFFLWSCVEGCLSAQNISMDLLDQKKGTEGRERAACGISFEGGIHTCHTWAPSQNRGRSLNRPSTIVPNNKFLGTISLRPRKLIFTRTERNRLL